MKYPKTLIEAKDLLERYTYDPGWNKQSNLTKYVNLGQSENQERNKKETEERYGTFEIPSLSFAQNRICTQVQDPKETMGYQISRYKSQVKDIGRASSSTTCPSGIPRSDGTNTCHDTTSEGATTAIY